MKSPLNEHSQSWLSPSELPQAGLPALIASSVVTVLILNHPLECGCDFSLLFKKKREEKKAIRG